MNKISQPFFSFILCSRPNDLVVVDENRFYVTNDMHGIPAPLGGLELAFTLPSGSVAFYDGDAARIVARGFKFANGVNVSPDKK